MLVGRAREKQRLKAVVGDPTVGLVLVQGPSGAGKTALLEATLAELCADGAIAGHGKYAEGGTSSAFAPIVQALSEAASKALELLYDPAAGAASLQDVLGAQKSLLAAAGFEALDVLPANTATTISSSDSAVQLIDALARVMRWLDGFGVPVILFVDDWQRAPPEADAFAALASRDHGQKACTVVLAERTDAGRPSKGLRHKCESIVVGALDSDDRERLLSLASGDNGAGAAISEWLGASASGLPIDLLEASRALHECGALNQIDGKWSVDPSRAAVIDRADFSETIVRRARALSPNVLELGIALALWGDQATLDPIAEALGRPFGEISGPAAELSQAGIIHLNDGTATFAHDRLRAAMLAAVSPAARAKLAASMAENLAASFPFESRVVARATLHLKLAGGLADAAPEVWRDRFALGARAARMIADTAGASQFAEAAWTLQLREPSGDPAISRMIYCEALYAAAIRRDSKEVRDRAELLISHARTPRQLAEAYEAAIMVARLIGDFDRAWALSTEAMGRFGFVLPTNAKLHHIIQATIRWQIGFALDRFRGPAKPGTDFTPLGRLSNIVATVAFEREPMQAMLLALRLAARARSLGLRDPVWLSTDAFICANLGDYRRAAALGAEASAGTAGFLEASSLYRALYFGLIWKRPLASLRDACLSIYNTAMAEGDLGTAALAIRNRSLLAWRTEATLTGLLQSLADDTELAERLGDLRALRAIERFASVARALQEPAGLAELVKQTAPADPSADWAEEMPVVRIEVLALTGNWSALADLCEKMKGTRRSLNSHTGAIILRFYESIARLRLGLPLRRGDMAFMRRVAALNPADHRAKVLLLEADLLRLRGKREASLRTYALAVELATGLASRFEAGVIADCAAFGVQLLGDQAAAARHEATARSFWRSWGAFSKLNNTPDAVSDGKVDERAARAETQALAAVRDDRAKSRFLAEVGHELRTPLQAMQSLLDLAAEQKQTIDIGQLRDVFTNLRSVVDELTDIGALGAEAPLNLKPADLSRLVESEATLFANLAARKGLLFTKVIDWNPEWRVRIDEPRVRQVVRNLLSNAVKFVGQGEICLRLSSRISSDDRISVSITIDDTGPGLREADLAKLFEPFERGGKDEVEGLGLGMALSRRIAQRMGGTLHAENRSEGGARFVFAFSAEQAVEPVAMPLETRRGQILLVEDVSINRRLLATLLRGSGHTVEEAADGGEAISAWSSDDFDLVILDLGLPDMNGLDVLRHIRLDPDNQTPVVVLTASAVEATDARATEAGATRVLHKPVSGDELRMAVGQVLRLSLKPAEESNSTPDLTVALEALAQEARREIWIRSRELAQVALHGNTTDVAASAHQLAGIAGQFGEEGLAAAADMLERCAREGEDRAPAILAINQALADSATYRATTPSVAIS